MFSSRTSHECRPARAHSAKRRVQRQEGQDAAAQVGRAAGHPLWHLSNRGLGERQPDREDAHLTPGGGKGESSLVGVRTNPVLAFHFPLGRGCAPGRVDGWIDRYYNNTAV